MQSKNTLPVKMLRKLPGSWWIWVTLACITCLSNMYVKWGYLWMLCVGGGGVCGVFVGVGICRGVCGVFVGCLWVWVYVVVFVGVFVLVLVCVVH